MALVWGFIFLVYVITRWSEIFHVIYVNNATAIVDLFSYSKRTIQVNGGLVMDQPNTSIDQRISAFMQRKERQFPDLRQTVRNLLLREK